MDYIEDDPKRRRKGNRFSDNIMNMILSYHQICFKDYPDENDLRIVCRPTKYNGRTKFIKGFKKIPCLRTLRCRKVNDQFDIFWSDYWIEWELEGEVELMN